MIEKRVSAHGDFALYATQNIKKGTRLFSYAEWIEDEQFGWSTLSVEELMALPEEDQNLYLRYAYDVDFNRMIGTFDWTNARNDSNFMNHSCDPNMQYDAEDNIIARRDIRAGEELTIDYAFFVVNVDQNFECRCGSPNCRRFIRKDDWKSLAREYGLNFPTFMHSEIKNLLQGVPA